MIHYLGFSWKVVTPQKQIFRKTNLPLVYFLKPTQTLQEGEPELLWNLPGVHGVQLLAKLPENVPAGQVAQAEATSSAAVPPLQGVQEGEPELGATLPLVQVSHWLWSTLVSFPAAQGAQAFIVPSW